MFERPPLIALSTMSTLVPAIFALAVIRGKARETWGYAFAVFVLYAAAFEIIYSVTSHQGINNQFLSNYYSPPEFIFWTFISYRWLTTGKERRFFWRIIGVVTVCYLSIIFLQIGPGFNEGVNTFSRPVLAGGIFFLVALGINAYVQTASHKNRLTDPRIWLLAGAVTFYAIEFTMFAVMLPINFYLAEFLQFRALFNIAHNICFAISLWLLSRSKHHLQHMPVGRLEDL